jgi:hypothetical protein
MLKQQNPKRLSARGDWKIGIWLFFEAWVLGLGRLEP